jgi:hypothetical protein
LRAVSASKRTPCSTAYSTYSRTRVVEGAGRLQKSSCRAACRYHPSGCSLPVLHVFNCTYVRGRGGGREGGEGGGRGERESPSQVTSARCPNSLPIPGTMARCSRVSPRQQSRHPLSSMHVFGPLRAGVGQACGGSSCAAKQARVVSIIIFLLRAVGCLFHYFLLSSLARHACSKPCSQDK